jgi:hypothetical protein
MSGTLTCLVLYDESHRGSFQLEEEYLTGMLYERDSHLSCRQVVVLYDESHSGSFQLGEDYLAGMLYERDSHLSCRIV